MKQSLDKAEVEITQVCYIWSPQYFRSSKGSFSHLKKKIRKIQTKHLDFWILLVRGVTVGVGIKRSDDTESTAL